ncbi:unnamed protein product [Adineta ricciae]|uniref:Polyprenal reductase n=1 Tax=Adineta ricciae TaxID=249248 RepID=A0A813RP23_ADIRI|nr:unnamed protein product [Adineta ricciae]CAF1270883.1 unnamed protein product [Adineta ricciae]
MLHWNLNALLTFAWLFLSAGMILLGIWLLIDCPINLSIINQIIRYFDCQMQCAKSRDTSKFYFINFYIVTLLVNVILFIFNLSSFLLFSLFLLHIFRRLYECLYVHQYVFQTNIDYLNYFLRLLHYPCVGLTIIMDYKYSLTQLTIRQAFLALILFFNASYIQYNIHVTLAKQIHSNPDNSWIFNSYLCPNSLAEIAIYFSFYIASYRTSSMAALLVWIVLNQTSSALLNHRWYGHKLYSTKGHTLVPFIL